MNRILSIWLLSIFLIGSIGIAIAQPAGKERGVPPDKGKPPRPHLQPVLVGHGFALAGEEFHVLSVNVIKARVLPPRDIRKLLKENKTIEEIRGELEKNNRIFVYRGHMKFTGQHYALNMTHFDNTSLDADILKLPPRELAMLPVNESIKTEVVGHISIVVMDYEGSRVGTGTLEIDGESYNVLLNIAPPRRFPGRGDRLEESNLL